MNYSFNFIVLKNCFQKFAVPNIAPNQFKRFFFQGWIFLGGRNGNGLGGGSNDVYARSSKKMMVHHKTYGPPAGRSHNKPIDKRNVIGNNQGGVSGPAIKPIAVFKTFQVAQVARPLGIPIIGQGGVTSAADAIEFLLAGATAVGVGTGLFYDPLLLKTINAGLIDYLDRHGMSNVAELSGALR